MKIVNVVAAVIMNSEKDKVFATQRGYGEYKDGWEFPGGKIEPGETPEQALVCEIEEELNTEIAVDKYLDTIEYDYPEFHLSMRCYICHVKEGKLELLEHEAAKWLDARHIQDVDWLPADRTIINEVAAELQAKGSQRDGSCG